MNIMAFMNIHTPLLELWISMRPILQPQAYGIRYVRRSGFDRRRRPAENLPAAAAFRRDADDFFRRRRDFGVSRF